MAKHAHSQANAGDTLTTVSPLTGAPPSLKKARRVQVGKSLQERMRSRLMDFAVEERAEWVEKVCKSIGEGATLAESCRTHGLTADAFNDMCDADPAMYGRYVNALGRRAQAYAEEIISIGDDLPAKAGMAEIQRATLRVKSRQFVVERLIDVYKAKREVQVNTTVALTDEQVDLKLQQLLGKAMNQHIIDEARTVDL
jgi:hypothetical protein